MPRFIDYQSEYWLAIGEMLLARSQQEDAEEEQIFSILDAFWDGMNEEQRANIGTMIHEMRGQNARIPHLSKWNWAYYENKGKDKDGNEVAQKGHPYLWVVVDGFELRLQRWPPFRKAGQRNGDIELNLAPRWRWDICPGTAYCSFGYTHLIERALMDMGKLL